MAFRDMGPYLTPMLYANGLTNMLVRKKSRTTDVIGAKGENENFWGQYFEDHRVTATQSNGGVMQIYTHIHELGHALCSILTPDNLYQAAFLKDWRALSTSKKTDLIKFLDTYKNDSNTETMTLVRELRTSLASTAVGVPTTIDIIQEKDSKAYRDLYENIAMPLMARVIGGAADGQNIKSLQEALQKAFPASMEVLTVVDPNQDMECAFSDNAAFTAAYKKGIMALLNEKDLSKPHLKLGGKLYKAGKLLDNISYYLPKVLDGIKVGGDFDIIQDSREEMFAQLFAEIMIDEDDPAALRALFPDAAKLVEQLVSVIDLKTEQAIKNAPTPEIYSMGTGPYSIPYPSAKRQPTTP